MRFGHSVPSGRGAEGAQEGERAHDLGEPQQFLLVGRGRRFDGRRGLRLLLGACVAGAGWAGGWGRRCGAGASAAAAAGGCGWGRTPNSRSRKFWAVAGSGDAEEGEAVRAAARIASCEAAPVRRAKASARTRPGLGDGQIGYVLFRRPNGFPLLPGPSAARRTASGRHGRRSPHDALHALIVPFNDLDGMRAGRSARPRPRPPPAARAKGGLARVSPVSTRPPGSEKSLARRLAAGGEQHPAVPEHGDGGGQDRTRGIEAVLAHGRMLLHTCWPPLMWSSAPVT